MAKKKSRRVIIKGKVDDDLDFSELKKGKKVPEPLESAIRKKIGKKRKIGFAGVSKVSRYKEEIGQILKAIGVDGFVSDLSQIGDFDMAIKVNLGGNLKRLSSKLSVPVSMKDYVWKVAKKIRDRNESN